MEEGLPDMPHMTTMCVHAVNANAFAPLIILKVLKDCPHKLYFADSGLIYISSSPSLLAKDTCSSI